MAIISQEELAKITYLNPQGVSGRTLLLMPLWDGFNWHLWTEAPPGKIIKMQAVDAVHSNYVAQYRAAEIDIWIFFIDFMWQRASWPDLASTIAGIGDDFHILATSVAKLNHFFAARESIRRDLISSFVKTELEYLLTVSRSVFDLLQEAISKLWNKHILLNDPEQEKVRKRHPLPDSFTKMALKDRHIARTATELMEKYAIPPSLAAQYERFAPFYVALLQARDRIMHQGKSVETIFVTNKGFCVDPKAKTFSDFEWKPEHYFNENIVSLLPWIAYVVYGAIEACNDITNSFVTAFEMPGEIAPGYRVFIRDPANEALIKLGAVAMGQEAWWSDEPSDEEQKAGSPPTIVQPSDTKATD